MMWRIVVIADSGRVFPHWSEETRARAREALKRMRAAYPNARFRLVRETA